MKGNKGYLISVRSTGMIASADLEDVDGKDGFCLADMAPKIWPRRKRLGWVSRFWRETHLHPVAPRQLCNSEKQRAISGGYIFDL